MNAAGVRNRWWALGALALSLLTVGLDTTVLSVALPTVATDLHATTGELQWFNDAYLLVLAAAMLPAGLLGDRFGRKKLLLAALAVFGVASAACAYATSAGDLIAARALLGLGAAFMMPLSMGVLPVLFTEEERPRALTIWVTSTAIGLPLGPILGGWLLDNFWWGSVFLINVPLIAIALVAVAVLLPESRSSRPARLDVVGVLISSLGLGAFVFGIIEAGERGWDDPTALTVLGAGVVVLAGFVAWERRQARRPDGQPLVDLALFRSASFAWGAVLATLVSFAMFGLMFAAPQYFQAVNGADALGTGLRLLPIIGGLLVGSRIGDRVTERAGARVSVVIGFVLLAAGLGLGATTGVDSGYGFAAAWIAVIGVGLGFALPAAMGAAMGALDTERSGSGSALLMVLRQVGSAVGVALLGTVLSNAYRDGLDLSGLPGTAADAVRDSAASGVAVAHQLDSAALLGSVRIAFVDGMDLMLWVCGAVSLLGLVLAAVFLPRRSVEARPNDSQPAESDHDLVAPS